MPRTGLFAALIASLLACPAGAQDSAAVNTHYRAAVAAAERGDLNAAIEDMQRVLALDSTIPNAYWNLGLWYSALNDPASALSMWTRYRLLVPDDWHARAKTIQAYQALGDSSLVAQERDSLFQLHASGRDSVLSRQESYVRDQFRVGARRVMAFEAFAPTGEMRVFFTYYVFESGNTPAFRISLGSYDFTTTVAREAKDIGPEDRVYHLDRYDENSHATYAFFRQLPDYSTTKGLVIKALEGALTPVSGSTRNTQ